MAGSVRLLFDLANIGRFLAESSGECCKHDEQADEHDRVPDGHDQADQQVHGRMLVATTGGLHGQKVMGGTDDVAGGVLYVTRR